jgi:hypothetical protein
MKLLWKEWQQQKWIIFSGLLAGVSFPVFECLLVWNRNGYFRTDTGSGVLLAGGAIFAVILAIATMHHDIRKGVDSFWQSKPVRIWKLFTVKFLLGALLLYVIFLATISLDLITHFSRDNNFSFAWAALCYTYPIGLCLFGLSMFIMVLTRDAAKTAFLAIWAGLLIYFLPLMFRGLEWMNIFERLNNRQQPSVVENLMWLFSLPEKVASGMTIYRPSGVPVSMYQMNWSQALLYTIGSPAYLRYLLFVAVFFVASIVCVLLSVKSLRYNWRWRPGQKSIVWALGISAAAIFGFAMFQVGHNLVPAKELNGKQLINPVQYDWNYMPASLREGLPEGHWIGSDPSSFGGTPDLMCVKDDLMFRFTMGYQSDKGVDEWDTALIRHFVLQVYQFPYAEKNSASSVKVPDFVVGATKFFQTEPVIRMNQDVLGCFIRGDRLYAAYRPLHKKGEHGKNNYPGSLNPMYFITFDISAPALPKVVSNMEISNSDHFGSGMADSGNYCYINDGSQLMILSVENRDQPEIVRKITFEDDFMNRPTELGPGLKTMAWFPAWRLQITGDKLVCWDRSRITMLDITNRLEPQVIYDESFNDKYYIRSNGIEELAFRNETLYLGSDDGIFVLALEPNEEGFYTSRLLGQRRATPLEKLASRNPGELLLSGDYLIEQAGGFGMLVYDVSNPSKPRRVYHAQVDSFANDIGFWNGLLYMQEYYCKTSFYKLPENTNAITGVNQ